MFGCSGKPYRLFCEGNKSEYTADAMDNQSSVIDGQSIVIDNRTLIIDGSSLIWRPITAAFRGFFKHPFLPLELCFIRPKPFLSLFESRFLSDFSASFDKR
jgi:hypothetical protein